MPYRSAFATVSPHTRTCLRPIMQPRGPASGGGRDAGAGGRHAGGAAELAPGPLSHDAGDRADARCAAPRCAALAHAPSASSGQWAREARQPTPVWEPATASRAAAAGSCLLAHVIAAGSPLSTLPAVAPCCSRWRACCAQPGASGPDEQVAAPCPVQVRRRRHHPARAPVTWSSCSSGLAPWSGTRRRSECLTNPNTLYKPELRRREVSVRGGVGTASTMERHKTEEEVCGEGGPGETGLGLGPGQGWLMGGLVMGSSGLAPCRGTRRRSEHVAHRKKLANLNCAVVEPTLCKSSFWLS